MDISLTKIIIHYGDYRNIRFEILQPSNDNPWCYYIHLQLKKFVKTSVRQSLWTTINPVGYFSIQNEIFDSIYFRNGCTFYQKYLDDFDKKNIKMGCVYGYSSTTDYSHTIKGVLIHVKKTIDSIYNLDYCSCEEGDDCDKDFV
jgi:hypothetical protein